MGRVGRDEYAELAQKLKPYIVPWIGAGAGGTALGGAGVGIATHALNGPYHTGTLAQSQAPWALSLAAADARYLQATRQVIAGAGLTGGGVLTLDVQLDVGAGAGITVNADSVALASSVAGAGLTFGSGVLAVGAGAGIAVGADDVALASTVAGNGLTFATGVINVGVANTGAAGLSVEADVVRLTSSSNPGAAAAVLASDASGMLSLLGLHTPLIDTASGNLTLQPAGDLVLDPTGNDVLPATNYDINMGAINKKWLQLHAAELWVEYLVAQNTIATIGGRILVGPTTTLTRDLAAGATTIYVKHNQMTSGDRGYMEAGGSVEFFAITSGPTTISATEYSYSVTRDLDGTGSNQWYAGDAMFNTGKTNNGWIDLYSIRGVKTASQYGPTIVGNVRNSATYNDWTERWAVGNLNGLYGYGVDTYGFAAGDGSGSWVAVDASSGFRIMRGSTPRFNVDANGDLFIRDSAGGAKITLDSSGNSYFSGRMTIGTSGEIMQGTGTLGSNYTGLRIWHDTGVGRIGGYNNNTLQWYAGTDGYLYAGGGAAAITRYGYMIQDTSDSPSFTWPFLWGGLHAVNDITAPGTGWKASLMFGEPTLVYSGGQRFRGWLFQFAGDLTNSVFTAEGSVADYALTIQDAAAHVWKVWHQGNDGSSSGLDADLLDGYDSAAFGRLAAANSWTATQTVTANGNTMRFAGTDHSYFEWYPQGLAAGRKAYFGYNVASSLNMVIVNEAAGSLALGTSGSTRVLIESGGNVNVGTSTNTYSAKLNVAGDIHTSTRATVEQYFQLKTYGGVNVTPAASGDNVWSRLYVKDTGSGGRELRWIVRNRGNSADVDVLVATN